MHLDGREKEPLMGKVFRSPAASLSQLCALPFCCFAWFIMFDWITAVRHLKAKRNEKINKWNATNHSLVSAMNAGRNDEGKSSNSKHRAFLKNHDSHFWSLFSLLLVGFLRVLLPTVHFVLCFPVRKIENPFQLIHRHKPCLCASMLVYTFRMKSK